VLDARETHSSLDDATAALLAAGATATIGVTGARASLLGAAGVSVQEIEAGARGTRALLECDGRLGDGEFLLVLLGTGTAFAAVRGATVQHRGAAGGSPSPALPRRAVATHRSSSQRRARPAAST
jgi:hypothetical protein